MLDCLQDETVEGALGDYLYAWKNGQQILIGTRQQGALLEESVLETTAFVFMSKDEGRQQRRPSTWNELRALLAEGWVVGTDRKPGVKGWYPQTGRSIRRQMQDIYVFRQPRPAGSGDSIHIGSISNNTGAVAVGWGARATVINQVVQGLGYLQTQHAASVRNFLDYYVGTSDSPEPFGGRESDLAAYTRWLDDPAAPPYALLSAPAGMGKSAALAHWVLRIEKRQDLEVVFFPISDRFQTNSEAVVFSALYSRLAFLHGDNPTPAFTAAEYRGAFLDYLTRPLPDRRRLLVVLDGLDEAAGWEARRGVFPTIAPSHLKVMVAARHEAGDLDWAIRLGWTIPEDAVSFGLGALSRTALAEVLLGMGNPLDGLSTECDIVERLYELTDHGDPLLIGLYVEALRKDRDRLPDLRPEDLIRLEPGLKSFFDLWFEQQEHLWLAAGGNIDRRAVDTLTHARAMAFGPLVAEDLAELAPETFQSTNEVRRAAHVLRRFLVGNGARGNGYSFSHSRLSHHFRDQLSAREQQIWTRRFSDVGAAMLAKLESGALSPNDASEYHVRHYRLHLQAQEGRSPELICALMCRGWSQAWYELEHIEAGFLNDVNAAMECAVRAGPEWLGQVVRGALCFSSVASLSARIDTKLVGMAISRGALNSRIGLHMARSDPQPTGRSLALADIAAWFGREEQTGIFAEALAAAREETYAQNRAYALVKLAKLLPSDQVPVVLMEALAATREIQPEHWRIEAIGDVLALVPVDDPRLLVETLMTIRGVQDEIQRAIVLSVLAERLPVEGSQELLREALTAARGAGDEIRRPFALSMVAKQLPTNAAREALADALTAVRRIRGHSWHGTALTQVSRLLPADARDLLAVALTEAREIRDEARRAHALCVLVEQMSVDEAQQVLAEALMTARKIGDETDRVFALCAVAQRLRAEEMRQVVAEALITARRIGDERDQARALCEVATWMSADEARQQVLAEALMTARRIGDEGWRAIVLNTLVTRLPLDHLEMLAEARAAARLIKQPQERAKVLTVIAERLPADEAKETLKEALAAARGIEDRTERVVLLSAAVKRLPADEALEILADALAMAREITVDWQRATALTAVAEGLPAGARAQVAEALAQARNIGDDYFRTRTLMALGIHLSIEQSRSVLSETLVTARGISSEDLRVRALSALAKQLPADEQRQVLTEALMIARGIEDKRWRAMALSDVGVSLPNDKSREVLGEALATAQEISDEGLRAEALCAVAEGLSTKARDLLDKALTVARKMESNDSRAWVLSTLAGRLPADEARGVATEAIAAARRVPRFSRSFTIRALGKRFPVDAYDLLTDGLVKAPTLADDDYLEFLSHQAKHWGALASHLGHSEESLLAHTLLIARRGPREVLLGALCGLFPVIDRLAGVRVVREIVRAIRDTAEWWP